MASWEKLKKQNYEIFGRTLLVAASTHLDELAEEPPADVVVRLEEDLPEPGLADGVVLGIELVEPVEGVAILWVVKVCQCD